jgi:peroxiredoxin
LPRRVARWKALADRASGDSRVQTYGVSLDSLVATRAYAIEHELTFPVVSLVQQRARGLLDWPRVPQIRVLNDEDRVAFTRLGVLESDAAVDSIVAAARDTSNLPP